MKKLLMMLFVTLLFVWLLDVAAVAETLTAGSVSFDVPEGYSVTQNDSSMLVLSNSEQTREIRITMLDGEGLTLETTATMLDYGITYANKVFKTDAKVNGIPYVDLTFSDPDSLAYGKLAAFLDSEGATVYGFLLLSEEELTGDDLDVWNTFLNTIRSPAILYQALKEKASRGSEQASDDASEITENVIPEVTYETLQIGDKGDGVRQLQQRLIDLNYLSDKADGSFGKKTEAAVRLFQSSVSLPSTGIADAETQKALYADDAPAAKVYKKLEFKAISRDPDIYTGQFYSFTGIILQVTEEAQTDGSTGVMLRIATKSRYDDVVLAIYYRQPGESRVLEDDNVTVFAEYRGLYTYESVTGKSVTVPAFAIEQISVN